MGYEERYEAMSDFIQENCTFEYEDLWEFVGNMGKTELKLLIENLKTELKERKKNDKIKKN